jgi:signal transduction histidine kinase
MVKRYQGIGLGLYTAKRIAESLRGDLRIESELNVGTTAYLVLPLELYTMEGDLQR